MAERLWFSWIIGLVLAGCSDDPVAPAGSSDPRGGRADPTQPGDARSDDDPVGSVDNPALPTGSAGSSGGVLPLPGSDCAPGHYVGSFSGEYKSGAWMNGDEPINFATSDFQGMPGFEFWLEAVDTPCPPGSEFCVSAVVKGGKLRGFATPFTDPAAGAAADDPFALSVRFEIDLTGELDCSTGTFRGQLQNGCYDVLSTLYRFAGEISSDYDPNASAFTEGMWSAVEVPMDAITPPSPDLGGGGTWDAQRQGPGSSPAATGAGLCSGTTGFDTP